MNEKKTKEPIFEYTGGPASQTEKEVMHSPYGILPSPQITSKGEFKCPICKTVFKNLGTYNLHRHKEKEVVPTQNR